MGDATPTAARRALWRWTVLALVSLAVAFASVAARRWSLERGYRHELATEAKRRAIDILAQTMAGNVMGAVATMGLVNHPLKDDARGLVAPNGAMAVEPLRANGEAHRATALYVVNQGGIVQSCWCSTGPSLTGANVGFRTYFRAAMQGQQIVSAGTSASTGTPALYVAAPLYGEVSSTSPIIGVVAARLGTERIDSVLKSWPGGPALLLSPQRVVFTSSRSEWTERTAVAFTAEQLSAVRALRQFSRAFDERPPVRLLFSLDDDAVRVDGHRYAIARAPVHWNDPQGEWSLVLLGDLDQLLPASQRALYGTGSGLLALAFGAGFLTWRRRLRGANEARAAAEAAQQAYAMKLYFDSEVKSFVADLSVELHRTETPEDFARTFLYQVTTRVAADYGAFYVLDPSDGLLHPVGGYAVAVGDLAPVALGEGMVGQCAQDQAAISVSTEGDAGIRIVLGVGTINASHLLVLPIQYADRLLGVVAFASIQSIDEEQRALLDVLMPTAAMNLEMLAHRRGAAPVSRVDATGENPFEHL